MERYELDALLEEIAADSGAGTWHVSLYVRPDKSVQQARNEIASEIAEAESIKSDQTRFRVQNSLKSIRTALSNYRETPDNGVAVFASPEDVYVLDDLPFEVPENRYHCGKEFLLEPLKGCDTGAIVGLIVVERGEAAIGVLNAGRIESVHEKESMVMGKTQAGGFSQQRFERLRKEQKENFFDDVSELARSTFRDYDLDGVVIGGTLDTAKEFASDYTRHDWNILGTYSVDHGDEQGLEELVERAESRILEEDEAEVRQLVQSFLRGVKDGSAAYGSDEVDAALEHGKVETLLLSSDCSVEEIRDYKERAQQYGTDVMLVSGGFEQAEMFRNMSGGYGALLRW